MPMCVLVGDGDNRLFLQERSTGRMVGLLHVMPADRPDACEIGVVVAPDAPGGTEDDFSLRAFSLRLPAEDAPAGIPLGTPPRQSAKDTEKDKEE